MTNLPISRRARFDVGDRVRTVGPSVRRHASGTVSEVVISTEDVIYRYRVKFEDGSIETFFGFELERASNPS
jgi:hypothetical protein